MARDIVIDIAKGIAIICVVLGHIKGSVDLSLFPAHTKFVHQFHIPMFFFVSGMLYKAEGKWLPFIKKNIRVVCPLCCIQSSISGCIHC